MKPVKFPPAGALLGWLPRLIAWSTESRAARGAVPPPAPGRVLRGFRLAALSAIAAVITTASAASFAESYRGLWLWANRHGLAGFWAAAFPLQVDAFIVVGELSLFIAMTDRWRLRDRLGAWTVALLGLVASVAGNIGHVAGGTIQTHGTAAVPPLAAFAALWVGLGVLKRTLNRDDQTASATGQSVPTARPTTIEEAWQEQPIGVAWSEIPADAEHAALIALRATAQAGNPLSGRQLETRFGLTRAQATKVRKLVLGDATAHDPTPEEIAAAA